MHIIVHIGPPKTGTSSIQNALQTNRDYLATQGINVYRAPRMTARALALCFMGDDRNSMPGIRRHFQSPAEAVAWSKDCWRQFETEISAKKPEISLISSEMFGNLRDPSEFIARLRRSFERISVVGYVRDPVDLYVSQLAEYIRSGVRFRDLKSPSEYVYPKIWRVKNYVDLIGIGNVYIRNFARSNLQNGDVVVDFFQTISHLAGREVEPPNIPARRNETLSAAASVWLLTLNETFEMRAPYNTKASLAPRFDLIDRLRNANERMALPSLKLTDRDFVAMIRHNAGATCAWYNENFLRGQEQLVVGPPLAEPADHAAVREKFRDWLLTHLTQNAVSTIGRTILS